MIPEATTIVEEFPEFFENKVNEPNTVSAELSGHLQLQLHQY